MCESHEITANAGAKPSYDMYTTVQVMQRREMTHTLVTTKLQNIICTNRTQAVYTSYKGGITWL